jgi:hypothetical protein
MPIGRHKAAMPITNKNTKTTSTPKVRHKAANAYGSSSKRTPSTATFPWEKAVKNGEFVDDDDGDWALEQPVWSRFRPPGFRLFNNNKIQAAWLSSILRKV